MRNALIVLSCLLFPALAMAQNSAPVADAGADQSIYLGSSVSLHGTATDADGDAIVGWIWEIESSPAGSTPLLGAEFSADASFLADVPGDYALSLVAFDGTDWSIPDSVVITYVENQPPIAIAAASPITGTAPLTVQLDGTQSWDPEGAALIHAWEFGDGTAPTLDPAPVHTYQNPGRFFAQLAVEDDFGQLDFDTVEIVVTTANTPPDVAATATPNNGDVPLVVQFFANASDADGDDLTYVWDFGDPTSTDNTSTLAEPQHVYEAPGTYVAWLTVSDGRDDTSASVTVVASAGIPLSTSRASVVAWNLNHQNKGTISYWADLDLPAPSPDDVISLTFDGIKLFSSPFSRFEPSTQPNVYLIVKRWYLVRIDLDANTIYVEKQKANLKKLDNSDGIDVELLWGDAAGVDQFMMAHPTDTVWIYERD